MVLDLSTAKYQISVSKQFPKGKFILGLAEKPTAAGRIALTLNKNAKKLKIKVSRLFQGEKLILPETTVYELTFKTHQLIIIPALGHLFTLIQDGLGWQYPVYDFKWVPDYYAVKSLNDMDDFHLRKESTVEAIRYLANKTDRHVIMTDYDAEGELIGALLLRELVGEDELDRAKRMKYSSFSKNEIQESFITAINGNGDSHINFGMYNRGLMRHYLDWLWGINLSRALMLSLKNITGRYQTFSTGRVQGPTLHFVANREKEISKFVPIPRFRPNLTILVGSEISLKFSDGFFERQAEAKSAITKIKKNKAVVKDVVKKKSKIAVPVPYNLSSLQNDAYRYFKLTPSRTLHAAENLYLAASISYPRTSSEQYPSEFDHNEVISKLSSNPQFKQAAKAVAKTKNLQPKQGKKTDPAHPCIYPLGNMPGLRKNDDKKVYSLIVHRYLATFGKPAVIENSRVNFDVGGYPFFLQGKRTISKGWRAWAGKQGETTDVEIPVFKEKQSFAIESASFETMFTRSAPRYNPSSLLKKMEETGIGTKATRSEIIKNLFDRKFLQNESIEITPVGSIISNVLKKYSSQVVSVELSRKLEAMGDLIEKTINENHNQEESFTLSDAIVQGITYLHQMLDDLQKNEYEVGRSILLHLSNQQKQQTIIGTCPNCGIGDLKIITSQASGKRFIGCSQYFVDKSCDATFPIPQKGRLQVLSTTCPEDNYPQLRVFGGKRPWVLCLNPTCPLKEAFKAKKNKRLKGKAKENTQNEIVSKAKKRIVKAKVKKSLSKRKPTKKQPASKKRS